MIKILFVCHGNICRSPMAEFIMKDIVNRNHRNDDFYIESAATSSEEIWNGVGNPVYPAAKKKLAEHGISCDGKHARQIQSSDYDKYDFIIGMDDRNIQNMLPVFQYDPQRKIHELLEYTGSTKSISDPWYSGNFDTVYQEINQGCIALFEYLK